MSATKPRRRLAPGRHAGATRSSSERAVLASASQPTPAPPVGPTRRASDSRPVSRLDLAHHNNAPVETWWESFQRAERANTAQLDPVWLMAPVERIAAMRRGELSYRQLSAWSARYPDQVPTVHGEFEWILSKLADVCE